MRPPPSTALTPAQAAAHMHAEVDARLLEVLVCPVTHAALDYDRAAGELISRTARLAYPIRDGVPVMLPEEARELGDGE